METLIDLICTITSIEREAFDVDELCHTSMGSLLPWATANQTTRVEDLAYHLLGSIDINMYLLYGRGPRACSRHRNRKTRRTNDMSLLAWAPGTPGAGEEILAKFSSEFSWLLSVGARIAVIGQLNKELGIISKGLRVSSLLKADSHGNPYHAGISHPNRIIIRPTTKFLKPCYRLNEDHKIGAHVRKLGLNLAY